MQNQENPTAEQLIDNQLDKRKQTLKHFFTGWIKDNYDKAFLIILIAALIIRIWIFTKTLDQALWYDAANYLATSKKWGLGLTHVNDIWYYRRGAFWVFFGALIFKIGLGETTIRFATTLFSTGIVFVSYFLIKDMFNKKLALMASIAMTFSWVILFFTGRPMTSIPATFFLLTALLFFYKGYILDKNKKFIWLFGLFFALSVLTRMQYAMFIIPFLIAVFLKEKFRFLLNKHLWISVLIFALIFSPHFYSHYVHYGNPVTDIAGWYFGVEIGEAETVHQRDFSKIFDYFKDLPYSLSKPIFILFLIGLFYFFTDLVLGFDKVFKNKNLQKKIFILFWIITPLFVLGYITDYVEQRYYIQILPFLFTIAFVPLLKIENLITKNFKITKKLATLFIFVILILILVYPNLTTFPNTKSNLAWGKELIDAKKSSYYPVKQSGEWIKQNSDPGDVIISNSKPQTIYYSERKSYTLAETAGNKYNPEEQTEEIFNKNVSEIKPKFLIISAFENHQQRMIEYPQKYQLIPIQAYPNNQQPTLIIYEFPQDFINQQNKSLIS